MQGKPQSSAQAITPLSASGSGARIQRLSTAHFIRATGS